jgi:SWIM/SEC-C metal-binding protein
LEYFFIFLTKNQFPIYLSAGYDDSIKKQCLQIGWHIALPEHKKPYRGAICSAVDESYNILNGEKMKKEMNGQKTLKLGTKKKPAVVKVQTEERLKEITSIFEENGWEFIIGLEPDKPEDITDLDLLLNKPKTTVVEKTVGRNEPCPCGSGKKYKKCCAK